MAEELENAKKQVIAGRTVDGKYIVLETDADGHMQIKLVNSDGTVINPSTEDNQDAIITRIDNVTNLDDLTLRVEDYYPMIAQGKIEGRTPFSRAGKILNPVTIGFEIISNIPVIHPGGIQLQLVSTSADDTIAGTGIQKIRIKYYDSNSVAQQEIVEMDGLTPKNTTATDINRIECMRAYQIGSGNVAAGTITAKDTGATNLYAQIDINENFCPRCLHYAVPGSKSFVTDILISSNTKEGVEFRLVVTKNFTTGEPAGGKVLAGVYASKILDTAVSIHFNIPLEMDASESNTIMGLFLAVRGEAANQEAFGSIRGYDEVC